MIPRRKLRERRRMEQFSGVRTVALNPQKNLKSRNACRRNCHRSLLSQTVTGLGPVTINELRRRHATLSLQLNLDQLQYRLSIHIFSATDKQARSFYRNVSGL